eukprot:14878811-Alexandrium_andersonii.AAC.1
MESLRRPLGHAQTPKTTRAHNDVCLGGNCGRLARANANACESHSSLFNLSMRAMPKAENSPPDALIGARAR